MRLSTDLLHSFDLSGNIVPLSGGQSTSIKVGNAVLKPVDDVRHCEWLLNVINLISPQGYRIAKPIRSKHGTFVRNGWSCTHFEEGQDTKGRIQEKLLVSKLFHRDLSSIPHHDFPPIDNPWSKGHRIAWQKDKLPSEFPEDIQESLNHLLGMVTLRDHYDRQIVHSDLSGNILFDEGLNPLVIDFSPTIAPVEYAEAILVCDCIAWQGSEVSEIGLLPRDERYKEMIIRAIVFRLAVAAIFSNGDCMKYFSEYQAFKPIIDHISSY